MDLRDATTLVTGAASGIGRATSLELARRGARVIAVDLDAAGARATANLCDQSSATASSYGCDVADRGAMIELAERVAREHGSLDVLVNNAGVGLSSRFHEMSMDDWEWIRSVNLDGVLYGCHAFVPEMLERQCGHVVNVSSALGYWPSAAAPAYSTTKAAVLMFTRAVRADWARSGVGVSAICPGFVNTPILERSRFLGSMSDPRAVSKAKRRFGRGHSPQLVADAIAKAIERNKAVVAVGVEAHVGRMLTRWLPDRAVEMLTRPRTK